ncbi:nutrient deprivation-induced protein [Aliirhizobium smilacinae]|uniref:nutrient deprivation-induced protein n=1 Tax=Aliirhizobium smilacinae TaxID=1395944 RepID=UPI001FE5B3F9|nr:nutrient deprivation-induced protein [Rhizobium smilacinae]
MTNEFGRTASGTPPSFGLQPTSPASQSSGTSSTQFEDLKAKVGEDVTSARDAVKEGGEAAVEKVKDVVTDQKTFAAHQVGGIATALEKVGAELEGADQQHVGRYAKQIGSSVQSFAKDIEGKDLGEIASMAEEFGRKQPLAFLGVAALAGLAASRFLTASSARTDNSTKTSSTDQPRPSQSSESRRVGDIDNG